MIKEFELTAIINQQLPQLEYPKTPVHVGLEAYVTLVSFTGFTRRAVELHNVDTALQCFQLAAKLHRDGDLQVRSLIENIFVYDFGNMFCEEESENTFIRELIPASLYDIYLKQVMASGC